MLLVWGLACSSSSTATPADCQTLAKRCALCPAGDLKNNCETTSKGGNGENCKTQLGNKDLTDICVDSSPDGGSSGSSGVITDPCGVLGPLCGKCTNADVKRNCEDAVRATEPFGCRTFLDDPLTKSTCK
jgi:hypothetical protein